MNLAQLQTGDKAVIVRVGGSGAFRKRILEMGFVQGKEIMSVHNAPLKDPIYYKILDYNVSLRRKDAELIEVRPLEHLSEAPRESEGEEDLLPNPQLHSLHRMQGRGQSTKLPTLRIALVGNPNCGKTSLFNQASGAHEHVGNYSGVTVEAKTGHIYYGGYRLEIIDTCNLERNLYITLQLKELGLPVVVALNMFDEFIARKEYFDYPRLSRLLGVPMIPTVCRTGLGLEALFDEIISLAPGIQTHAPELFDPERGRLRPIRIPYGPTLEPMIEELTTKVEAEGGAERGGRVTDHRCSLWLHLGSAEGDLSPQAQRGAYPHRPH